MTNHEARARIEVLWGDQATERLARFADMVTAENEVQNLISPSTIDSIWVRHILDSAQLAALDAEGQGLWLDIGSGGGFPGMVIALLLDRPVLLCEPRRLRADFLARAVTAFGLEHRVEVATSRVEKLDVRAGTISARAVAPLDTLVAAAQQCATPATRWILPRGKSGAVELHQSALGKLGRFHVEHSITDPEAVIVMGTGIGPS